MASLAERLTRDRIHRTLFGEFTQAPTNGRYTFLKEIGHGGMGVVCTAYDPKLDRKVAIKLTRSLASASAESRARILREAQAMARLSHPNVVQVYEVGRIDEQVFVAMEFVQGKTLGAWLKAKERGWLETLNVLIQAGRGLQARLQRGGVGQRLAVPEHLAAAGDIELDDLGGRLPQRRRATGHLDVHRMQLDRDGDDQHHQQHQHHVHQRRGVDVDHDLGVAVVAASQVNAHARAC